MTGIDVNCLGKRKSKNGILLEDNYHQLNVNYVRIEIGNNILLDSGRKMLVGKKPKGWYESSSCEIQRRVEKGFAGFECFGYKKVKLYVVAFIYGNSCLICGNLCLQKQHCVIDQN